MNRYSVLHNREIVLLKSKPCFWGQCSFCDYIEDNAVNIEEINSLNVAVLKKITGEKGALEVINSGSCFELPHETLMAVKEVVTAGHIKKLYLESHWHYRHRLKEIRSFFGIPVIFKIGIETFDNDFRNNHLNKNAYFKDAAEVKKYFDSVCLMVGIKGQTKEMISKDIALLLQYFDYGTINIFTENTTPIQRDDALISWFIKEYEHLKHKPGIDVLIENTDFGVGNERGELVHE